MMSYRKIKSYFLWNFPNIFYIETSAKLYLLKKNVIIDYQQVTCSIHPWHPLEHLVEVAPEVVAHGNHRAVDKRDARAFAKGVQLHEHHHLEEYPWHQLHEAVVGNGIRELLPELPTDADKVVLLEGAVRAEVIAYQDGHNLALGQLPMRLRWRFTPPSWEGSCSFLSNPAFKFLSNSSITQKNSVFLSLAIIV